MPDAERSGLCKGDDVFLEIDSSRGRKINQRTAHVRLPMRHRPAVAARCERLPRRCAAAILGLDDRALERITSPPAQLRPIRCRSVGAGGSAPER